MVHQKEKGATSTHKTVTKCAEKIIKTGYKCVRFNARSIVNKKNDSNVMVEDTNPHINGKTEFNGPTKIFSNTDTGNSTLTIGLVYQT